MTTPDALREAAICDARPKFEASTAEPSIRKIVTEYYRRHFDADDAIALGARYCDAILALTTTPLAGEVANSSDASAECPICGLVAPHFHSDDDAYQNDPRRQLGRLEAYLAAFSLRARVSHYERIPKAGYRGGRRAAGTSREDHRFLLDIAALVEFARAHPRSAEDVCECGDYRRQHRGGTGPCDLGERCFPNRCKQFRLETQAPTSRNAILAGEVDGDLKSDAVVERVPGAPPELYGAVGMALFRSDFAALRINQKINAVGNAAFEFFQAPTPSNIGDAEALRAFAESCADRDDSIGDDARAALAKLSGAGDGLTSEARLLANLFDVDPIKWSGEEVRRLFDLVNAVAAPNPPKATCTPPVGEV